MSRIDRQRIALIQFPDEPPMRTIGLAWRRTSRRKADFTALGALIRDMRHAERRDGPPDTAADAGGRNPNA